MFSVHGGFIHNNSKIVTVTGTPTFNTFATSGNRGEIEAVGTTFSGAATGTRYAVSGNAVISTAGGGANFFPGSGAGSAATGGQYS